MSEKGFSHIPSKFTNLILIIVQTSHIPYADHLNNSSSESWSNPRLSNLPVPVSNLGVSLSSYSRLMKRSQTSGLPLSILRIIVLTVGMD